ncbi:MAG TPA: GNAT family N-acetyltransferase, partial [Fimbriimonadaceae bacterium]|nr:GNAT family N-acetyltransferase [Fimbriimonadaceae bacterium]
RTARLEIRLPELEDAEAMRDFYVQNEEFLQPWSPSFDESLFNLEDWYYRIGAAKSEFDRGAGARLVLFHYGGLAGITNFTSINGFPQYSCLLGYSLAEGAQGKGLMEEGLRAAIPYVFRNFHLHRIYANYMPRNERSGRLLRRLGFEVHGYVRDYLLIDGVWEDHIQTSLLNPDWEAPTLL